MEKINVYDVLSLLALSCKNAHLSVECSLTSFEEDDAYDAAASLGLGRNNSHLPVELLLAKL